MAFEREPRRQSLTARELEVLALLCEGMPNKTIQRGLGIGAGTVKCHVGSILGKLGVASRLQAVVAAHRLGLLEGAVAQAKDDDESPCARKDAGPPVWLHRRIDGPLTAAA